MHSNHKNDKNDNRDNAMIEEYAEVIRTGQGYAEIRPEVSGGCSSCASKPGCSSSSLSSVFSFFLRKKNGEDANQQTIRVQNPVYAKPGDKVVIGVRANTVLKGSLLAYFLPLLILLISAVIGRSLFGWLGMNAELGSILMGMMGLLGGFKFVTNLLKHSSLSSSFEAVILRVAEPELHPVSFSLST